MSHCSQKNLADYIFLIENAKKKQSKKESFKTSGKYITKGVILFILGLILFSGGTYLVYFLCSKNVIDTEELFYRNKAYEVFLEGFKLWVGGLITYILTVTLTNRWQQRNFSFEMIKELHSPEFHNIRCALVNQMEKSIAKKEDIDNMSGWFPFDIDSVPRKFWNKEQPGSIKPDVFYEKHALSAMLYFILRIANYEKFDMLNVHLTRHLFHFFFSHYEVLMLEFAEALNRKLNEEIAHGRPYDERWLRTSNDISRFFTNLGLSGELAPNHTFINFPSLNKKSAEKEQEIQNSIATTES